MAAVTAKTYWSFWAQAAAGNVRWGGTDGFKVALLSTSDIGNVGTHAHYSDLTGEVPAGNGYTTGGTAITVTAPTVTSANQWPAVWAPSVAYQAGTVIRPTSGNGYVYTAVTAGTSGATQPVWPTVVGQTVTDSGVLWSCTGESVIGVGGGTAQWQSATIAAAGAVVYDSTSGVLVSAIDFGGIVSSTNSTFTVPAPASGWAITVPA